MLPLFYIIGSHQENPNYDSLWLVHYNKKNCKAKAIIDMPPTTLLLESRAKELGFTEEEGAESQLPHNYYTTSTPRVD